MELPDYLPNIHPVLVHFPIALIIITVGFQIWSNYSKETIYGFWCVVLYGITSLSLIGTYFSGRNAANNVFVLDDALGLLSTHADRALILVVYCLSLTGLVITSYYQKWNRIKFVNNILVLMGIAAVGLLMLTADAGGRLVYGYGVGVKANFEETVEKQVAQPIETKAVLFVQNDGSWAWESKNPATPDLMDLVEWHQGAETDLEVTLEKDGSSLIEIVSENKEILFTLVPALGHIKVDANLELSDFQGDFRLIHHFQNESSYDYLKLAEGKISLGRNENGNDRILDTNPFDSQVGSLSVVGDGRHFRGYINEKMVVHGHAASLAPGLAGIFIRGKGHLLLGSLSGKNLKQE